MSKLFYQKSPNKRNDLIDRLNSPKPIGLNDNRLQDFRNELRQKIIDKSKIDTLKNLEILSSSPRLKISSDIQSNSTIFNQYCNLDRSTAYTKLQAQATAANKTMPILIHNNASFTNQLNKPFKILKDDSFAYSVSTKSLISPNQSNNSAKDQSPHLFNAHPSKNISSQFTRSLSAKNLNIHQPDHSKNRINSGVQWLERPTSLVMNIQKRMSSPSKQLIDDLSKISMNDFNASGTPRHAADFMNGSKLFDTNKTTKFNLILENNQNNIKPQLGKAFKAYESNKKEPKANSNKLNEKKDNFESTKYLDYDEIRKNIRAQVEDNVKKGNDTTLEKVFLTQQKKNSKLCRLLAALLPENTKEIINSLVEFDPKEAKNLSSQYHLHNQFLFLIQNELFCSNENIDPISKYAFLLIGIV